MKYQNREDIDEVPIILHILISGKTNNYLKNYINLKKVK